MSESLDVATKDEQISIRLEPDVSERATALSDKLSERAEFKAFRMTRAAVLRMAMLEGLGVLEERYGVVAAEVEARPRRRAGGKRS